jgi:hypothetical protein
MKNLLAASAFLLSPTNAFADETPIPLHSCPAGMALDIDAASTNTMILEQRRQLPSASTDTKQSETADAIQSHSQIIRPKVRPKYRAFINACFPTKEVWDGYATGRVKSVFCDSGGELVSFSYRANHSFDPLGFYDLPSPKPHGMLTAPQGCKI